MKRREWASLIILALATVPALLVAIGQVYVTGVDGIRLRRTETIGLLTEIAVLFFLYLFFINYTIQGVIICLITPCGPVPLM